MISVTFQGTPESLSEQINQIVSDGGTIDSIIKTKNNATYIILYIP